MMVVVLVRGVGDWGGERVRTFCWLTASDNGVRVNQQQGNK